MEMTLRGQVERSVLTDSSEAPRSLETAQNAGSHISPATAAAIDPFDEILKSREKR